MTKKHMLLMLASCLIPIGLIVAIGALAIPTSGLTTTVIALMCPAMMLFMMFGMRGVTENITSITRQRRSRTSR